MRQLMECHRPSRLRSPYAALTTLLFGLWLAPATRAAMINVDTLADEDVNGNGTCSLREALTAALNQAAYHECPSGTLDNDTITFSVSGTITLGSQLPDVGRTVEIVGPGVSNLTISGNDAVGILFVDSAGFLKIHDLTLADGRDSQGAAIYINDDATLIASRVAFTGNEISTDPGQGGWSSQDFVDRPEHPVTDGSDVYTQKCRASSHDV